MINKSVIATGIDSLLVESTKLLQNHGKLEFNNRTGSTTQEILGYCAQSTEPRDRIIRNPERKNNVVAQIAETFWVMMGSSEIKYIQPFLPRAADFSDNGKEWRAAYGARLRNYQVTVDENFYCYNEGTPEPISATFDQLHNVYRVLKNDPSSRQAYMIVPLPGDNFNSNLTLDTPCTLSIQFIIRNGRLNCFTTMRSNDLIWGQTGINFFEWTFIQESLASMLSLEVGDYYHFVGSYHCYERHFGRLKKIVTYEPEPFQVEKHIGLNPKDFDALEIVLSMYKTTFNEILKHDQIDKLEDLLWEFKLNACKEDTGTGIYALIPLISLANKVTDSKFKTQLREFYQHEVADNYAGTYLIEKLSTTKTFLN